MRIPLALLLALLAVACHASRPQRIVSLNLAADQLLLTLADREQIAALTWFAADPTLSNLHAQAKGIPALRGEAEEVLLLRPDAVFVGRSSAPNTTLLLRRLGLPLHVVNDSPADFEQIEANIRTVAVASGHPERGEAAIARLRAARQALAASPAPEPPLRILPYEFNHWSPGLGTLTHTVILEAGHLPVAIELGLTGYTQLSLERVLLLRPDVVLVPPYEGRPPALVDLLFQHPVWNHTSAPRLVFLANTEGQTPGLDAILQARDLRNLGSSAQRP
jgi:iron complex transport system substrate-binding protein